MIIKHYGNILASYIKLETCINTEHHLTVYINHWGQFWSIKNVLLNVIINMN